MNSKKLLISITAIIGMTLLDYKEIRAQTCSGANVSVGSGQNCNDVTLTINPSTLTTSGTGTIRNSVNSKAVFVNGVTANINNNGSILGSSTSAIDGIDVNAAGSVTTLNNTGTISASGTVGVAIGINAAGNITNFTNSGTISGTATGASATGVNSGNITNFTNSGTISGTATGFAAHGINNNNANITTLNNNSTGSISATSSGAAANGIDNNNGTITTLNNFGTISATVTGGGNGHGIMNTGGTITTLNNSQGLGNSSGALDLKDALPLNYNIIINSTNSFGRLLVMTPSGALNFGIYSTSTLGPNIYTQVLSGVAASNISNLVGSTVTGAFGSYSWALQAETAGGTTWDLIVTNGGGVAVNNTPSILSTCNSNASIFLSCSNLVLSGINGTIIINTGVLVTDPAPAAISNNGSTAVIINNGSVVGGIQNAGTLGTLQNAQGAGNPNGALNYSGNLPSSYLVMVNGSSNYGQLSASSVTGAMSFGIAAGSALSKGTYSNVLMGFSPGLLTNTLGTGGGYLYKLTQASDVMTNWNLIASASLADTNASLIQTLGALQGQFGSQSNAVITGMTYDCNIFGENNVCISAGGRGASNSAQGYSTGSALLIAAYRVLSNIRIGAYLDQNLSASNPNGIISASNGQPMGGLFAVWSDKLDGTGAELKASVGYNSKNMTVTRPVVGTSESGTGSTGLTSQGANAVAKYGFGVTNQVIVSPYIGVRYMSTNMGGYGEGAGASVSYPLNYSSINMNATTALAGLGANYKPFEDWSFAASAGVESDVSTTNGAYSVTNASGLTPVALNPNPVKTRPTAMLAAYYNIDRNVQLGLTGLYRTDSFSGMSSTTGMATITFGM